MNNALSSQLNKINRRAQGISHLSVLRIGVAYEVVEFHRMKTRFGDTIVATLNNIGGYEPIKVFLPRRFIDALPDEVIESYNNNDFHSINLVYGGLREGKHDVEFR